MVVEPENLCWVTGRMVQARDGVFDVGPTFFLYPQVLEAIFEAVGRDLGQEVELVRLDPQYRLIFGAGGELNATPDLGKMERAIAKICPADALQFHRFLEDNQKKFREFKPCLESPLLGWRNLFSRCTLGLIPSLRPWLSLDQELARYFTDPRLRIAF
jgi:phytoene desaturase